MGYLREVEKASFKARMPGDKYDLEKTDRKKVEDAYDKSDSARLKQMSMDKDNSADMRAFAKECLDDISSSDRDRKDYEMHT